MGLFEQALLTLKPMLPSMLPSDSAELMSSNSSMLRGRQLLTALQPGEIMLAGWQLSGTFLVSDGSGTAFTTEDLFSYAFGADSANVAPFDRAIGIHLNTNIISELTRARNDLFSLVLPSHKVDLDQTVSLRLPSCRRRLSVLRRRHPRQRRNDAREHPLDHGTRRYNQHVLPVCGTDGLKLFVRPFAWPCPGWFHPSYRRCESAAI